MATGGTVECVANIISKAGREVKGLLTVIELLELGGRSRFNFPVISEISI